MLNRLLTQPLTPEQRSIVLGRLRNHIEGALHLYPPSWMQYPAS